MKPITKEKVLMKEKKRQKKTLRKEAKDKKKEAYIGEVLSIMDGATIPRYMINYKGHAFDYFDILMAQVQERMLNVGVPCTVFNSNDLNYMDTYNKVEALKYFLLRDREKLQKLFSTFVSPDYTYTFSAYTVKGDRYEPDVCCLEITVQEKNEATS